MVPKSLKCDWEQSDSFLGEDKKKTKELRYREVESWMFIKEVLRNVS